MPDLRGAPRHKTFGLVSGFLLKSMFRSFVIILSLQLLGVAIAAAQSDTLLATGLDSAIVVRATRLPVPAIRAPYSIHQLEEADWQNGRQHLSLAPALHQLPGLLVLNPNNFAQDLRLSVRGFGARSAFGIRGIQIWVDGLPETTPDGQGQVDNLDGGILNQASLLSGPASGMYGNAAGGVLQLQTEAPPESTMAEARLSAGSYGFQRYTLKGGGQSGAYSWLAYGAHTRQEGYREHSRVENTLLNGRLRRQLGDRGQVELLLNYVNSPIAQDPGGLPADALSEDRRQAWGRNLLYDAGESVEQGRAGLTLDYALTEDWQLEAYGFALFRDFSNLLPFEGGGAVALFRQFSGLGGRLRHTGTLLGQPWRQVWGVDAQAQRDQRERFDNLEGERGDLVFNQDEVFRSLGLYTVQEWQPVSRIWLTAALRYDANHLSAEDAFLSDGNDSGERSYQNFSPSAGISYGFAPGQHAYFNYSYSFEAPALSELSANPGGAQGFNEDLLPQQAHNYEVGLKGQLASKLAYRVAAFYIQLEQERLPYELSDSPGRVFYRNAGRSRRQGVESWLQWSPFSNWKGRLSYTFSDFVYQDYEVSGLVLDGNVLPGIPHHLWSGMAEWKYLPKGTLTLEGRYLSELFADDANTATAAAFVELNFRATYGIAFAWGEVQAFGGINNLLDARYVSNVRLNAFGGRYFEAAPGRNVYLGLQIALQRNKS
jgi:iron complex outermembrane receptor protein